MRREDAEIGQVGQQVNRDHGRRSRNQGAGQAALRIADLRRDHADVIPAVVGPQRAHQRGEETGGPSGCGNRRCQIGRASLPCQKADEDDPADERQLQGGDGHLNPASELHAGVIDPAQHQNQRHRAELAVANIELSAVGADGQRHGDHHALQTGREVGAIDEEQRGNGGDGAAFRDPHLGPTVNEAPKRAVGLPEVDVFAAGLGHGRGQFCVAERTKKGQQTAEDPDAENGGGRSDLGDHLRRNAEDSAPDDRSDHDGHGTPEAEIAAEAGPGLAVIGHEEPLPRAEKPAKLWPL